MSKQAKHRIENVLFDLRLGRISISDAYHLICNIVAEAK